MSPFPPKKYISHQQNNPPQKNTEDNFYEVQTTKCTKTLYKTDTIHPVLHCTLQIRAVLYSAVQYSAVQCSTVQCSAVQCSAVSCRVNTVVSSEYNLVSSLSLLGRQDPVNITADHYSETD